MQLLSTRTLLVPLDRGIWFLIVGTLGIIEGLSRDVGC